jgi:hypothetical protein
MTGVQTNDKTLQEPDPPPAVEVLVYEVRASAYETWKAAEHEHWTKAFADRFAFFVGKETWLCPGNEWHRVTVVIFWRRSSSGTASTGRGSRSRSGGSPPWSVPTTTASSPTATPCTST